jgi:hypothetical protein
MQSKKPIPGRSSRRPWSDSPSALSACTLWTTSSHKCSCRSMANVIPSLLLCCCSKPQAVSLGVGAGRRVNDTLRCTLFPTPPIQSMRLSCVIEARSRHHRGHCIRSSIVHILGGGKFKRLKCVAQIEVATFISAKKILAREENYALVWSTCERSGSCLIPRVHFQSLEVLWMTVWNPDNHPQGGQDEPSREMRRVQEHVCAAIDMHRETSF